MCERFNIGIIKKHLFKINVRKIVRCMKKKNRKEELKEQYGKVQDLYLDIDGVLVDLKYPQCEPYPRLVPDITDFIFWAMLSFDNIYFLTCWTEESIKESLRGLPDFEYCNWKRDKTEAIDYSRSFYWLEDGITSDERKMLGDKGFLSSYVYIDPYDNRALTRFMERCSF